MALVIPRGFRLAGVHCGIKQEAGKEDLTLVVADREAVVAGVFTQNAVVAAPVIVNRQRTPSNEFRVVVINSGNANACTGERGQRDAEEMTRLAAQACGVETNQALVMSTGIIGEFLPMEKIAEGVTAAAASLACGEESLLAAARGMTTTDKSHKIAGRTVEIAGREFHVTGMAKGAGMIGPKMATMLAVVMTDAPLVPADAQRLVKDAVDQSFNCISVEGHMSTNDTVLLLASGAAHDRPLNTEEMSTLASALTDVCVELARMIPDDGEGTYHLITIDVHGCATRDDAHRIASTMANSPLVKTGIAGADPNWGRFISAAGQTGVRFDPQTISLRLNGTLVYRNGAPTDFDAAAVSNSIRENRETMVELQLTEGDASIRFWTSDLTVDYVRFNSEYTT